MTAKIPSRWVLVLLVVVADAVTIEHSGIRLDINVAEVLRALPERELLDAVTAGTTEELRRKLVDAWRSEAATSSLDVPKGTHSSSSQPPISKDNAIQIPQHPKSRSVALPEIKNSSQREDGSREGYSMGRRLVEHCPSGAERCERYFILCNAQTTYSECQNIVVSSFNGIFLISKASDPGLFHGPTIGGALSQPMQPACLWTGITCENMFDGQSKLLTQLAEVKKEQLNMKEILVQCVERRLSIRLGIPMHISTQTTTTSTTISTDISTSTTSAPTSIETIPCCSCGQTAQKYKCIRCPGICQDGADIGPTTASGAHSLPVSMCWILGWLFVGLAMLC